MGDYSLSKKQVLLRVTTIVALVEFSIMNAFIFFGADIDPYLESILDTLILTALATPLLYIWVIYPFRREKEALVRELQKYRED